MATKPAQICQLQKGKLVDTQKGFVDTFNWAVQSIANLKGGENCDVSWPTDDHPTIDCSVGDNEESGGEVITEAVYDVIEDTKDGGEGITIQYTDDREDSFIPLSFVDDVSQATYQGGPALKIEYSSGANDKYIPLSAGGEVQFTGTNGSAGSLSSAFAFESASDANVVVRCIGAKIQIGVYYV